MTHRPSKKDDALREAAIKDIAKGWSNLRKVRFGNSGDDQDEDADRKELTERDDRGLDIVMAYLNDIIGCVEFISEQSSKTINTFETGVKCRTSR